MATLEMASFGPVRGAWEAVRFNMVDSTRQQTDLNRLSAVAASKVATRSASGVIGFWCVTDGSVMMIGGGGSGCKRADHGIGITEQDEASFVEKNSDETEYDFGYIPTAGRGSQSQASKSYSLNLWIR